MRCLMFSLGAAGAFVEDWAVAASHSAEVVGITKVRALGPSHGRRINRLMRFGAVGGFPVVFTKLPMRFRPKRIARRLNNWREVRRLLPAVRFLEREFGPIDIVHSHFYAGSGAVPRLAGHLGVPFVHTEHSSRLVSDLHLEGATRRVMEELFGGAAAVFFVSPDQVDFLRGLSLSGHFEVLENPVDDRPFRVGQGGYPSEVRVITVGHLVPGKRHDVILHAIAEARRRDPRVRLDIVGWGPGMEKLRALAEQLGISDAVRFTGKVERSRVAALLSQSDIYVHASATETFGVAIVEALFSGLPVVFADAGGVTRRIPPAMGVKVDPADAPGFARTILEMIRILPEFQSQLIAAQARELFAVTGVAVRLQQVYAEVAAKARLDRSPPK